MRLIVVGIAAFNFAMMAYLWCMTMLVSGATGWKLRKRGDENL